MSRSKPRERRLERRRWRMEDNTRPRNRLVDLALMVMVLVLLLAFWGKISKGAASCFVNMGKPQQVEKVSAPRP